MSRREDRRRRAGFRAVLVGLLFVGVGVGMQRMPPMTPGRVYWPWVVLAGAGLWVLVFGLWRRGRASSAGTVSRWKRRADRNEGLASRWQMFWAASGFAMRRKARVLLPSLREVSWWARLRTPVRDYATPVARVGRQRIWSPCRDVTVRTGGPGQGKTGEIACRILDAPGAVIATSTRTDLIELTAQVRARKGPIYVFNPAGVGRLASTIVFDPLTGCDKPATAIHRAEDLLSGGSSTGEATGEREWWTGQARRALAALLHAAALGGRSMRDVLAWVADPDEYKDEIVRLLRRSSTPSVEADAAQFLGTNERTRSSITTTIMPALGWLTDETAAAAAGVTAEAGTVAPFDVAELLTNRATVYLLGAEDANTAPLLAALTGHIAREARWIAREQPSGRLDPPLTMVLDEAAIIAPIPLDKWTADMGGNNITIHIACQSRAQLRQRWGENGAAAILNNTGTLLIYGASKDEADLSAYSTLIGDRDEEINTWDPADDVQSTTVRRVPILSPAQIAQLREGHVVIIRRGMPPAIGKVRMAWRRHDVRAARRRARRAERLASARATWNELKTALAEATGQLAERYPRLADLRAELGGARPYDGEPFPAQDGPTTKLRSVDDEIAELETEFTDPDNPNNDDEPDELDGPGDA